MSSLSTILHFLLLSSLRLSAAMPLPATVEPASNDLIASIQRIQRKFSAASAETSSTPAAATEGSTETPSERIDNEPFDEPAPRRHTKMLGWYGYYPNYAMPPPTPYWPPTMMPPDYYDQYGADAAYANGGYPSGLEDEDPMSRANHRRRPSGGGGGAGGGTTYKNSPIYYIRLPPTPYMFVPGLGYISQPPTIAPMTAMAPMSPVAPTPLPMSPFYNVPVPFLANGKPTSIYQWAGHPAPYGMPAYQPPRPQRPYRPAFARPPPNPYLQDSKVTHLKGPYYFNGRPEEIYLLPTPYNAIYPDPYGYQGAYY